MLAKTGQIFICEPGSVTFKRYEKLEALGVNPQQANKDGRTPLHIASTVSAFASSSSSSSHAGSSTLFDWFLARQDDVDMIDKDGTTALHLALTFSEYMAERLLQSGADPLKATKEGLNGLHLAARAKQANILGMMLETIRARAQGDGVPPLSITCILCLCVWKARECEAPTRRKHRLVDRWIPEFASAGGCCL